MAHDVAEIIVNKVHEMHEEMLRSRRVEIAMCAAYSEETDAFHEFYLEFSFVPPNTTRVRMMKVVRRELESDSQSKIGREDGEEIRQPVCMSEIIRMREKKRRMVVHCLMSIMIDRDLVCKQNSMIEDVCYTLLNMLSLNTTKVMFTTLDNLEIPRTTNFDDIPRWAQPVMYCTGMNYSLAIDPRGNIFAEISSSESNKQLYRWCRTFIFTV